ncbi:hypothetical protein CPB83DRAFT_864790 [Crepidotus variabilis]|uniref:F-box domain-containing protein n=1 Tax=Crepidotus variabilis TaxID=179855 RepID=A0A9P6E4F2_9AGAR|nr:hypothetical protein CPB83DRAFT_864790 [Crepidotus variabilis]
MNFIDQLPVDLITGIFSLICQPTEFHKDVIGYTPPFYLGTICRSWRNLAWSTPLLWTYIYLKVSSKPSNIQAELLKDCFARSGSSLLSIVFRLENENFSWDPRTTYGSKPFTERLLRLIATECARWKTLEVDIPNEGCADALGPTTLHAPHLQKLRIRICQNHLSAFFVEQRGELSHFFLEGAVGMTVHLPNRIPEVWKSITTIHLDNAVFVEDIIAILVASHQTLRHFHIHRLGTFSDESLPPAIAAEAEFPHIESLILDGGSRNQLLSIFPIFLSAPKLRKLGIKMPKRMKPADLQLFLDQMGVSLEVLRVRLRWIEDDGEFGRVQAEALIKLLSQHSKTLREFALIIQEFNRASDRFFDIFHRSLHCNGYIANGSVSGPTLLPLLKSYDFDPGFTTGPWDPEPEHAQPAVLSALQMVQSRWRNSFHWVTERSFKLNLHDENRMWVLDYLKEEVREGLQVNFTEFLLGSPPLDNWCFED